MRVKIKEWGKVKSVKLSSLLEPEADQYSGEMESVKGVAYKTAEAYGRLAELLVEKGVITVQEAMECSGVWAHLVDDSDEKDD